MAVATGVRGGAGSRALAAFSRGFDQIDQRFSQIDQRFDQIDLVIDHHPVEHPIRAKIREDCSPRHVPDEILQVPSIPRTMTGKKLEAPVKRILRGAPADTVASRDSLLDPAALDLFVAIAAEEPTLQEAT